jgi:methionine-rich copper-binding protein CopC
VTRRLATLALVLLVSAAVPAFTAAHAELVSSTPAANSSLAAPPARLELTFDEPVTLPENPLEVIGPGNVTWQVGEATIDGPVVSAPVTASGTAGAYTVVYRVVSGDGDPVSGSVRFTLTAAAQPTGTFEPTATPSRTPPSASGGGTLLWIWLAAGAVLLAALVFVTLRVRRPRR